MKPDIRHFKLKCHQAGLKVTPQRMATFKVLAASTQHPTAEMVFQKVRKLVPNISLDTVNRTLLTFSQIGLAFVVEGSGDAKRFDANFQSHQHFKCVKCKRIIDFHHKPFDNIKVPPSLAKRFKVLRKTVYLEGICRLCLGHSTQWTYFSFGCIVNISKPNSPYRDEENPYNKKPK